MTTFPQKLSKATQGQETKAAAWPAASRYRPVWAGSVHDMYTSRLRKPQEWVSVLLVYKASSMSIISDVLILN